METGILGKAACFFFAFCNCMKKKGVPLWDTLFRNMLLQETYLTTSFLTIFTLSPLMRTK